MVTLKVSDKWVELSNSTDFDGPTQDFRAQQR